MAVRDSIINAPVDAVSMDNVLTVLTVYLSKLPGAVGEAVEVVGVIEDQEVGVLEMATCRPGGGQLFLGVHFY
jgi:hypothetical protein